MPLFQSPFVDLSGLDAHIPKCIIYGQIPRVPYSLSVQGEARIYDWRSTPTSAFLPEDDVDKTGHLIAFIYIEVAERLRIFGVKQEHPNLIHYN